jgi:glycerol-3-phosphate acyltransferase PlsY
MDYFYTNTIFLKITLIAFAYIIGSIPSAVWIGKIFYNIDVREHGSGNAGFTNALRVMGASGGVPVLIIDVLKGFIAVKLAIIVNLHFIGSLDIINYQIILAIAVLLGHIFPVFAQFDGGKGVATLFGATLSIVLLPTLIAVGIFLVIFFTTKYVSLSSLLTSLSFPFILMFGFGFNHTGLIAYSLLIFVVLVITHLQNIKRLLRNEELKVDFSFKNKND